MDNYIVSARKYRPVTFATVVGQEALTTTLKNAIQSGRLAHAYLFCGPRGVGKTTCARIFARTINCLSPTPDGEACGECESCRAFNEGRSYNIHELDAASNNSVEDIRQLIEQVRIPPQIGKYKVFIIDEVHMLSQAAFNAFLKTLEEPPHHAVFVLATTEKHKILPTIMSRCQTYDFRRMSVDDIVGHLKSVAKQEGIEAEEAALGIIAQKADGGMRDALSIFDQVASFCGGNITYSRTIENLGVLDHDYYFRLTDDFLKGDVTACMLTLNEILSKGFDGQHFIGGLATHLRNLLVSQDAQTTFLVEASDEVRQRYHEQAMRCKPRFLQRAMRLVGDCDLNYKQSQNKRLLVELTLIEAAQLSADDETPGSGLCPTKILKPIFQKLNQQASKTSQTSVTSKTSVTSSSSQNSSSDQASPAPQRRATTQPRLTPRATSFSLRQATQPQAAPATPIQEATTQPQQPQEADRAVTAIDLIIAWREYAQSLPHEQVALSHQLDNMEPLFEDGSTTFTVVADNPSLLSDLQQMQPRIEAFLRQRLCNRQLTMAPRLRQASDKKRVFSRREAFTHMLEQSEALRRLKANFQLELTL